MTRATSRLGTGLSSSSCSSSSEISSYVTSSFFLFASCFSDCRFLFPILYLIISAIVLFQSIYQLNCILEGFDNMCGWVILIISILASFGIFGVKDACLDQDRSPVFSICTSNIRFRIVTNHVEVRNFDVSFGCALSQNLLSKVIIKGIRLAIYF